MCIVCIVKYSNAIHESMSIVPSCTSIVWHVLCSAPLSRTVVWGLLCMLGTSILSREETTPAAALAEEIIFRKEVKDQHDQLR